MEGGWGVERGSQTGRRGAEAATRAAAEFKKAPRVFLFTSEETENSYGLFLSKSFLLEED